MDTLAAKWLREIETWFTDKKEHFIFVEHETDEVSYASEEDCNIAYCEAHNIPHFNRKGQGGCIVHCKGTISINHIYSHDKYPRMLSSQLVPDFIKYLQSKGLNVKLDNNDILIDGYKVGSFAEVNIPPDFRWGNNVILFSMYQDLELVKNICKKPMNKTPKGLTEFGITSHEVKVWLKRWYTKHAKDVAELIPVTNPLGKSNTKIL